MGLEPSLHSTPSDRDLTRGPPRQSQAVGGRYDRMQDEDEDDCGVPSPADLERARSEMVPSPTHKRRRSVPRSLPALDAVRASQ